MCGYAGASTAASTLTPFTPPPTTTNPVGLAGQGAAVVQAVTNPAGLAGPFQPAPMLAQLTSAVPNALQAVTSPTTSGMSSVLSLPSSPLHAMSMLSLARTGATTPVSAVRYATGLRNTVNTLKFLGDASNVVRAANKLFPGLGPFGLGGFVDGAPVSASMGQAGTLGGLSVPPGWAAVAPAGAMGPGVAGVPGTSLSAAPAVSTGGAGMPGLPLAGMAGHGVDAAPASESGIPLIPRFPPGG